MQTAHALRSVARAHHFGRMAPMTGRASNPLFFPKISQPTVSGAIAVPRYAQTGGGSAKVRRAYPRIASTAPAGGFCTSNCHPGCCFDDNGMICCVTGGDRHLCVADCFAYRWPGQRSVGPQSRVARR